MSRYGIDYYGIGYYGSDNPIKFDATPFTANPYDHGQIQLSWTNPTGNWSDLVIVRNQYGFPVDPYDGLQIYTAKQSDHAAPELPKADSGLVPGTYYYYSIFVLSLTQYNWVKAGDAIGLAVYDYGYTEKMYNYLPEIYRISSPYTPTASQWDNYILKGFLKNFGFQLDYTQNLAERVMDKYNVEKVSGKLIPVMLNQFGYDYEPAIGMQQNRIMLRDSLILTKQKGSKAGLLAYLKAFTGWGVSVPLSTTPNPSVSGISVSHNLMLDYNDSSFEESTGHWTSIDGSADYDQLPVKQIKNLSLTSNVATVYIGANNYDVGNQVTITGLPYPLFNNNTYTITDVDQTSYISFAQTSSDLTLSSGYNVFSGQYGIVTPSPAPWSESTAPALFPNKTKGVMAVYNTKPSTTASLNIFCGDDAPINKGIPVTAGTTYSFSIYASKGSFSAKNVTAKIKWFDRFGALISTSSGSAVSDNTTAFSSSYRPYITDVAPTGAYYATPGMTIASVGGYNTLEHHYFDAAQFEASSSVTSFDEARQLHITMRANRINEITNPNFASVVAPWTVSGSATTSIDVATQEPNSETFTIVSTTIVSNIATVTLSKSHSIKATANVYISGVSGTGVTAANYNGTRTVTDVTNTSFSFAVTASDQVETPTSGTVYRSGHLLKLTGNGSTPVVIKSWDGSTNSQLFNIYYPNTSYTFSAYVKATSSTESVVAKINWYSAAHTLISTSASSVFAVDGTQWVRPYVTGTAPATAAYASVELDWSTVTSGDILYVDQTVFENSGNLLPYFDGSGGPGAVSDFVWEGNVLNAARSHYYKNKTAVQVRLFSSTLLQQITLGSTVAIYLAQPNT
jgi:hypothetical protein